MLIPVIPNLDYYQARPPIHILAGTTALPRGLTPSEVKSAYNLPPSGGSGTIAIISGYHHPDIESDLAAFDSQFGLPACTVKNKCLEIHSMKSGIKDDPGWDMETALDAEWAHAIAPKAKILVVESASDSGTNLLKSVDYARGRSDVTAVSMSWGGGEFKGEDALDSHFKASTVRTAANPLQFFASSGDDGAGVSWPAASVNVVAVGGTSLSVNNDGRFLSEKAWTGSGGGVSAYEKEPSYQAAYSIPKSNSMRAIPDVSYAADPIHGFSVYHKPNTASKTANGWYVVGGTSAGAPQWAAIQAIGHSTKAFDLYDDKSSVAATGFFRDIVSGANGDCGYYCSARKRYDYVTGLGSPLTDKF